MELFAALSAAAAANGRVRREPCSDGAAPRLQPAELERPPLSGTRPVAGTPNHSRSTFGSVTAGHHDPRPHHEGLGSGFERVIKRLLALDALTTRPRHPSCAP